MNELSAQIYKQLKEQNLRLCLAESATGGFISHLITNVSGISEAYKGGICVYSNEAKVNLLDVKEIDLTEFGAVSEAVAHQMALGACKLFGADVALCDTGIAGPDGGSLNKPVGLFYISVNVKGQLTIESHIFKGNRLANKTQAAEAALRLLLHTLELRSLEK